MNNRRLVTNDHTQCHRREAAEIHDSTSHRNSAMPDLVIAAGLVDMFGLCLSLQDISAIILISQIIF